MKNNQIWEILAKLKTKNLNPKIEDLISILLKNRQLETKKDQDTFLHPDITTVTPKSVGIDAKNLSKTLKRIKEAVVKKEQMIVFGDYDVDGIAGTAILWETITHIGGNITPYIPSRTEEGYGLSLAGIDNVLVQNPKTKVIITVDNGIVANEAVDYANTKGVDIILTDHHVIGKTLPHAFAIVHTTRLCGTGVAWMLSKEIRSVIASETKQSYINKKIATSSSTPRPRNDVSNDHLALVALATVADLVSLTNANRVLLAEGLKVLHTTKRPGIVALCEEAGIKQSEIGIYEIGHIIGPRLNAMGRIASAMDSLRLLCTKDRMRAKALAEKLGMTNKERQDVTKNLSEQAILAVKHMQSNLLFVAHQSYDEGVIGLVAGRLVEAYYRPAIVLSIGEKISKASARSIKGFNIIEYIRSANHLLINAGGHPMAAGFTILTEKVGDLETFLQKNLNVTKELLTRRLKIDIEIPLSYVTQQFYDDLQKLQPFGMGNPEPTFVSIVTILSVKQVGKEKNHLSMLVQSVIASETKQSHINKKIATSSSTPRNDNISFSAIAFGMGEMAEKLKPGQEVQIAYTIDENVWNDKKTLQLKIKDLHISS